MLQYGKHQQQQQQHLNFTTIYAIKLSIPLIFCTAIISLIYLLNAHIQLNIYNYLPKLSYMFQRIPHHPQGELLSLAQNYMFIVMLLHWLQKAKYCSNNCNKHCKTHIWFILCFNQCNNITISRLFWASDKSSPWGWCSIWYDIISYHIRYGMIRYDIYMMIWYDTIRYDIWYVNCNWVATRWQ